MNYYSNVVYPIWFISEIFGGILTQIFVNQSIECKKAAVTTINSLIIWEFPSMGVNPEDSDGFFHGN